MFRNGIVTGRRQLAAGWLPNNGIAVSRKRKLLPFVCINCQARRDNTSWRGKSSVKKDKPDNMISQIKRLEAHVQRMERAYNDQLKKRAATMVSWSRGFFFFFFFDIPIANIGILHVRVYRI